MNSARLILIFSLLIATPGLWAQTFTDVDWDIFARDTLRPLYYQSIELDDDYIYYNYNVEIEYPEFQKMSNREIAQYRLNSYIDTIPSWPVINYRVGVSAKKGQLDVDFIPIVKTADGYQRINSFKLAVTKSVNMQFVASRMNSRAATFASAHRYTDNSVLSSGKWVKVRVPEGGVYKITKSQLAKMGFSDPSKVRLFGYGGRVLSETGIENLVDDLCEVPMWREKDYLLFYANGTIKWSYSQGKFTHKQNPYSTHSYYFLNQSESIAPMGFPIISSTDIPVYNISTYPDYALYENESTTLCNYGRVLLDSYDYSGGRTKRYNFDLPNAVEGRATIALSFGSNSIASHTVSMELNESPMGQLSVPVAFSVEKGKIASGDFVVSSTFKQKNVIALTQNTTNSRLNGFLDYIRINFTRNLILRDSYINFRGSYTWGDASYTLSSANANTQIWNVTEPQKVGRINGIFADGDLKFTASAKYADEFVAVDVKGSFPSVEVVGQVANQNLHALGQTDMVIIVPANGKYTAQAQRLANLHKEQDALSVAVVRADEIYNEFSSGTPDATAYRRLMKMLYDRASTAAEAPKYLLLLGDGFADNRLLTYPKRNVDDYLLCFSSENSVSETRSYVLEDYFGYLDDGEGSNFLTDKVDIGIGRIPVQNLISATAVVDKIVQYSNNENSGSWQNVITLLADDGDASMPNQHMRDAENVANILRYSFPSFVLRRIYWDEYPMEVLATGNSYPSVTKSIYQQLSEGALLVNYTGHGSANLFSHEMTWKASDMAAVKSPRIPFWVTASCDISPFDIGDGSLGEEAMLNPNGGGIGLFTTTRTVYQSQNAVINTQFIRQLFTRNGDGTVVTLGDAVRKTKIALINNSSDITENKLQYILLGDPALKLKIPSYSAVIDEFKGEPANRESMISAGETVTVSGRILDTSGVEATDFSGVISPTIYDYSESVKTKNNTGLGAFSYNAHKKVLFAGSDSILNGRFSFTFPVPMDISYSQAAGLINLYAVSNDKKSAAQGNYNKFLIGGTAPSLSKDTIGPEIKVYLNTASFRDGDQVNDSPCLFAEFYDPSGMNTVGTGIGHDIVAVIDNSEKYTYNLNSYYTSVVGDYTRGAVKFPLSLLPAGEHTLLLRAWDVLNNSSVAMVSFSVIPNLAPAFVNLTASPNPASSSSGTTFVLTHDRPESPVTVTLDLFNFQGQHLWSHTEDDRSQSNIYSYKWDLSTEGGQPLPKGVYIYRATISAGSTSQLTKTGKLIVL